MRDLPVYERMARTMDELQARGLWRQTHPAPAAPPAIDLSSNSYLALHANAQVRERAARLLGGNLQGNLSSRLIAARTPLYEQLETELAQWKGAEAALVFNSGYAANTGIIQALCGRDTEVFCDRLNHASIIDGIRLSQARLSRYAHADAADLAKRLRASRAREKVIVTETVFSMDGDTAPLADICAIAREHGALLMADEAHAVGVFGRTGEGLVHAAGCAGAVDVVVGTLSKSVAGLGGYCAGDRRLREFFVNTCRPLIYSTALPASVLAWDLAAVRHIRANPGLGAHVLAAADGLRDGLRERGFDTGLSSTQIVSCLVPGNEQVMKLSARLASCGIKVPAIRSPTVPAGSERLRLSVCLGFSDHDRRQVLEAISSGAG